MKQYWNHLLGTSLGAALLAAPALASGRTYPLWDDVDQDLILRRGNTWVVQGEVHVLAGVTLTVEEGATILIKNGKIRGTNLDRAALIFDPGSRLRADRMTIAAAGAGDRPEKRADNAGVWFLGSWASGEKDGISVTANPRGPASSFIAEEIAVSDLGHMDPAPTPRSMNPSGDDVDGISLIGLGMSEWKIRRVESNFSGDDGFDVTNSNIEMEALTIKTPFEDALNISSSRVRVTRKLDVSMSRSRLPDREIFDLEVDDGPSHVVIARGARVDLSGRFGDEVQLRSGTLPQPELCTDEGPCPFYEFHGTSRSGPTSIFSIDQD
ncbi:MAG: hypothetical protein RIQ81_775 [Pseudomonadota bacterium]